MATTTMKPIIAALAVAVLALVVNFGATAAEAGPKRPAGQLSGTDLGSGR